MFLFSCKKYVFLLHIFIFILIAANLSFSQVSHDWGTSWRNYSTYDKYDPHTKLEIKQWGTTLTFIKSEPYLVGFSIEEVATGEAFAEVLFYGIKATYKDPITRENYLLTHSLTSGRTVQIEGIEGDKFASFKLPYDFLVFLYSSTPLDYKTANMKTNEGKKWNEIIKGYENKWNEKINKAKKKIGDNIETKIDALKNSDRVVRLVAARYLGKELDIHKIYPSLALLKINAIDALIDALEDEDRLVRLEIIRALENVTDHWESSESEWSSWWKKNRKHFISELSKWKISKSKNTISSYKKYLSEYPNGIFEFDAKEKIELKEWKRVKRLNNISSYLNYLNKYPRGKYYKKAKRRMEDMYWSQIRLEDLPSTYQKYLQLYPNGDYKDEAISLFIDKSITKNTTDIIIEYLISENISLNVGKNIIYALNEKLNKKQAVKIYCSLLDTIVIRNIKKERTEPRDSLIDNKTPKLNLEAKDSIIIKATITSLWKMGPLAYQSLAKQIKEWSKNNSNIADNAANYFIEVIINNINNDPKYVKDLLYLGKAFSEEGLGQAETIFKKCIEIKPRNADNHNNLAYYYFDHRNYCDAYNEWLTVSTIEPNYTDLNKNLSRVRSNIQLIDSYTFTNKDLLSFNFLDKSYSSKFDISLISIFDSSIGAALPSMILGGLFALLNQNNTKDAKVFRNVSIGSFVIFFSTNLNNHLNSIKKERNCVDKNN